MITNDRELTPNSRDLGVGNELKWVCTTCVLGERDVSVVYLTGMVIVNNVLQN